MRAVGFAIFGFVGTYIMFFCLSLVAHNARGPVGIIAFANSTRPVYLRSYRSSRSGSRFDSVCLMRANHITER
jgi:hypothetical protein